MTSLFRFLSVTLAVLATSLLLGVPAHADESLGVTEMTTIAPDDPGVITRTGTFRLNGSILAHMDRRTDSGEGTVGGVLIEPSFGLFLIDDLSVDLVPHVAYTRLGASRKTEYGGLIGARYYIPSGIALRPYAGLNFGMNMARVKLGNTSASHSEILLVVPLGVLYSVTPSVGVELGLQASHVIPDDDEPTRIRISLGVFGISMFF